MARTKAYQSLRSEEDNTDEINIVEAHNEVVNAYNEDVARYNRSAMRKDWRLVVILVCAIAILAVFLANIIERVEREGRPMPCLENQVYVWVPGDYPNSAKCVSNIDHGAHSDGG